MERLTLRRQALSARTFLHSGRVGALILGACVALLPLGANGLETQQSPALAKRYAEAPFHVKTPAFAPGKTGYTTHGELMDFVRQLVARHPHVQQQTLGWSQAGREIPLLVFTAEGKTRIEDIERLNRPIVWLIGQQHGDEPAGGEAMLAVAQELADGGLKPLLDRITVAILPRANPDGAAVQRRHTVSGADMNRDHLTIALPETQALHAAMRAMPPDVVGDFHEFSISGNGIGRARLVQSVDAMMLFPTHPMMAKPITELTQGVFQPALEQALERHQLSYSWYFSPRYDPKRNRVELGGDQAGLARNRFGLGHAISFLFETRGVGLGRQNFARRVASHLVLARALLQTTAEQAGLVQTQLQTVRAEAQRAGSAERRMSVVAESPRQSWVVPMLDPDTGAERAVRVSVRNAMAAVPKLSRPAPLAYVIPPAYADVAERLAAQGVVTQRLSEPTILKVEVYRITGKKVHTEWEDGSVRYGVNVALGQRVILFPAGTHLVSMEQPLSSVVAAALEPEAPGSYVNIGLIPVSDPGLTSAEPPSEVPIYRMMQGDQSVRSVAVRPH